MSRKNRQISSTIFVFLILLSGCITETRPRKLQSQSDSLEDALKVLEQCPTWIRLGNDVEGPRRVLESLAKLNRYDTLTLRQAIGHYLNSPASYGLDEMAKLFVLNRYLFDVPQWIPAQDGLGFGGWTGIPTRDGSINLLWPLELDASGRFHLAGKTVGYLGPPFLALDEFDYLLKKYGRRHQTE